MIKPDDLAPALRGKTAEEQARVVEAVINAARQGRYVLTAAETKELKDFLLRVRARRIVPDELTIAVNQIARQYHQHLVASAAGSGRNA
jgi:type II secretory ATPase GspE/PulE/Tfp pilus assembly ATPase PilB-like protein